MLGFRSPTDDSLLTGKNFQTYPCIPNYQHIIEQLSSLAQTPNLKDEFLFILSDCPPIYTLLQSLVNVSISQDDETMHGKLYKEMFTKLMIAEVIIQSNTFFATTSQCIYIYNVFAFPENKKTTKVN